MNIPSLLDKINQDKKQRLTFIVICFLILAVGGIFYSGNKNPTLEELSVNGVCDDSDGDDPFKKGAVVYADTKGRHAEEDFCVPNAKAVYEWTCKKTSLLGKIYVPVKSTVTCQKGCNDNGACIK